MREENIDRLSSVETNLRDPHYLVYLYLFDALKTAGGGTLKADFWISAAAINRTGRSLIPLRNIGAATLFNRASTALTSSVMFWTSRSKIKRSIRLFPRR
jgi:hypothetical protein